MTLPENETTPVIPGVGAPGGSRFNQPVAMNRLENTMLNPTAEEAQNRRSIEDTFRRMRNILDIFPAEVWTPAEAKTVLTALEGIVWGRPFNGGVQ